MHTPSSTPASAGSTPALQGALLAFQNSPRSPAAGAAQRADGLLTPGTSTAGSREASPMRRLAPYRAGSPRDQPRRDASPSISDASGTAEAPLHDGDWPLRGGDWGRRPVARKLSPARTADSFIAANLAAGRPAARSLSPARSGGADTRSIPSTTRLISMFEGVEGVPRRPSTATAELDGESLEGDPVKVDVPRRIAKSAVDTPTGATAGRQQPARPKTPALHEPTARTLSAKPAVKPKPEIDTALLAARQVARVLGERAEASAPPPASQASPRRPRPPTPPKPRGAGAARTVSRAISTSPPSAPAAEGDPAPMAEPAGRARRETASSEDSFVSASSVQSPPRTSPPALDLPRTPSRALGEQRSPARSQSSKSASTSPVRRLPAPPPSRNPGASSSSLHVGSLSDAIVASSLASSRLTPSNTGDPTPRAQPSSRLLQTLRTGDSGADHQHHDRRHRRGHDESDEETKKRKRSRRRGNRHSHKEGARKRWAGRISERQRRRYEALWASNRGLLVREHLVSSRRGDGAGAGAGAGATGPPDPEAYVVNVVARELWRRSRLPDDELEEVWALVDSEGSGLLGRREFVVGTWLVDQRLRGRKIPARVGDSVWASASGMVMRRK